MLNDNYSHDHRLCPGGQNDSRASAFVRGHLVVAAPSSIAQPASADKVHRLSGYELRAHVTVGRAHARTWRCAHAEYVRDDIHSEHLHALAAAGGAHRARRVHHEQVALAVALVAARAAERILRRLQRPPTLPGIVHALAARAQSTCTWSASPPSGESPRGLPPHLWHC